MKLVFLCPEKNKVFETDEFKVIEDKGVKIDDSGNKVWDAMLELTIACPFCGKIHVFHAGVLPCPFA